MSKLTNHHRERKDSKVRERACEREGLQQPAVYQREHLFFGFIGDSEGQLKAFENSGTFRRTPFTLENEEKKQNISHTYNSRNSESKRTLKCQHLLPRFLNK